jgi:hypothetical protein
MAKKSYDEFLIMPKLHAKFNDEEIEVALFEKSRELIGTAQQDINYFFLSGNFYNTRGYSYSAIRDWRGVRKPGEAKGKKPMLEATFACLSVYLSSLISFQTDFNFAYEEIKQILVEKEREDLWTIIEEKLPFVSLPPAEMFPPGLKSPISPYYIIRQDQDITLGELYPSVFLSEVVQNLKSRFFSFFTYEGSNAFGYFNVLPATANFGFDEQPQPFEGEPTTKNMVEYIRNARNLKDLFVALITCHNAGVLEQYLVDDYETFLNRLLEIQDVDEGEN